MKELIVVVLFLLMSCSPALSEYVSPMVDSNKKAYVVITSSELAASVHSLQLWKEYCGFSVEVVLVSWIDSHYAGQDLQEKIRTYLIDTYDEGIPLYVLLVGSLTTIPMRTCHPIPWEYPDSLLTDFYYADLTGDWDADHDGYFGEYEHDSVNFTAEAFVGRIPCDDPVLVQSICNRIICYENDQGAWKKHVLSLASMIYYQNLTSFNWKYDRSDGATLTEECWIDIFQPQGFTHVCMYEQEGLSPSTYGCDVPLTEQNVVSEWTKGYGIVNMLGHSTEVEVTRFIWDHDDGDQIPEFEGGELLYIDFLRYGDGKFLGCGHPPVVYSAGCSQFHAARNMGKEFLERGAAVAYIGTTDISFYNVTRVWRDESDGGAFSLDYYFFKFFVSLGMTCGAALAEAKSYFADHFMFTSYNPDWIYRCYSTLYGFTLYGDPALGLTTDKTDTTPPTLTIEDPQGYMYLFGRPLIPLPSGRTICLGTLPIRVSAADVETGVARLELWIDEVLVNSTTNTTLVWSYDETGVGKHIVKIVAVDIVGNRAEREQSAWILNFNLL